MTVDNQLKRGGDLAQGSRLRRSRSLYASKPPLRALSTKAVHGWPDEQGGAVLVFGVPDRP